MPTAWVARTVVSPGAATAAGRGLSPARAPPVRSGRSRKGVAFAINRIVRPRLETSLLRGAKRRSNPFFREMACFATLAIRFSKAALRRHRLVEVLRDLVEEARGRQPALIGADQEREVLGHVAVFDGGDADLLQRACELRQRVVVVELGAMAEA